MKQMFSKFLKDYEFSDERKNGEGGVYDGAIKYIINNNSETSNQISNQGGITFNEALETVIEIIFANLDVFKPAVAWFFSDLILYPQMLEKLNLPSFDMIDRETLKSEEYRHLLHIIQESARVHPAFPISMPETLAEDIELRGHALPKGTSVTIDQFSLNHNPKYWSNPSEFQPERFQNVDDFMDNWGMFRFGFGGRRCPGKYHADLFLANAAIYLFSRYKVDLSGTDTDLNHHQQIPSVPGWGLLGVPGLKVQLKRLTDN